MPRRLQQRLPKNPQQPRLFMKYEDLEVEYHKFLTLLRCLLQVCHQFLGKRASSSHQFRFQITFSIRKPFDAELVERFVAFERILPVRSLTLN